VFIEGGREGGKELFDNVTKHIVVSFFDFYLFLFVFS